MVDRQGDLGLGRIVEHLVMGHPDQLAVNKGAERTPMGVVRGGQAGGEGSQMSWFDGESRRYRFRSGSC